MRSKLQRSHARSLGLRLLSLGLVLCLGFEWPGRLPHLQYELKHATPARRVEVIRVLAHYEADDVREALLEALEDDTLVVREAAASVVAETHVSQAVPILIEWLRDADASVRLAAAEALGLLGDARAHAPLTALLSDTALPVKRAAITALPALAGEACVSELTASLADADDTVRSAAAHALGACPNAAAALPALSAHLKDSDARVRAEVVSALAATHAPNAASAILPALADSDVEVQLQALLGLGRVASPTALTALQAELTHEPRLAKAAIAALGHLDDPRARASLLAQLGAPELSTSAQLALLEPARNTATAASLVEALAQLLRAPRDARQATAAAQTLVQLAELTTTAAATDALIEAITAQRGEAGVLATALARSGDPRARGVLAAQLARADVATLPFVLQAFRRVLRSAAADGGEVNALLALLPSSQGETRAQVLELLGASRSPQAKPALLSALASTDPDERLAALAAIGALGDATLGDELWPLMAADDLELRSAAARALGELADEAMIARLLNASEDGSVDRSAVLIALGPALARASRSGTLSAQVRDVALAQLDAAARSDDASNAAHALLALERFGIPEGAGRVARLLRSPSAHRRKAAVYALGAFGSEDTRRLLRFVLQHNGNELTTAAVLALGEVGDQRDASALLQTAQRSRWPAPPASAYALARLATRDVLKKRTFERGLCELSSAVDPYVRANVAAGLAALGSEPCADDGTPSSLLDSVHAPVVRVAAARWTRAALDAHTLLEPAATTASAALRSCATDADPAVAHACVGDVAAISFEPRTLIAFASDGTTPLRNRLVALRWADGSTFVGYTDDNAELFVPSAPSGAVILEDPTQTPPER